MYEMLTGACRSRPTPSWAILTKHMLEPPVPPRQRRPNLDIPADVEAVCLRALEKDRDKRFADMDAFYRALGAAGGMPSSRRASSRRRAASLKQPTPAAGTQDARARRRRGHAAAWTPSRTSGRAGLRQAPGAARR